MKRTLRSDWRNDAMLLWCACAVALCASCYVVFNLLGTAIDRQRIRTEQISARAFSNAATLAQRPELERAERVLTDRLRYMQLTADKPTTVARFVRVAANVAASNDVRLVRIDERAAAPTPVAAASGALQRSDELGAFESIPLDVTLRGSYPALLTVIRKLAEAPVSMEIEIAALERDTTTGGTADRPLTAHLHIVLQRLRDGPSRVSVSHSLSEDSSTNAR